MRREAQPCNPGLELCERVCIKVFAQNRHKRRWMAFSNISRESTEIKLRTKSSPGSACCSMAKMRKSPSYSPPRKFYEQTASDTAHRGHRPVHGEHGFDGDCDIVAGHRRRYRYEPADAQARDHLLSLVACRFHPGERLDRRPLRPAAGILRRRCGF